MERKIELIEKLLLDWKNSIISSDAAMIALGIIINKEPPSKEATEWAYKELAKTRKEKI